ncbi:MAG: hypothetical protein U0270_13855 [Labilithrix sp.]
MSFLILRSKDMKHVRGLLRAAGYLSVTALAFSAYSIKVARAEMRQTSLSIGRDMLKFVQASHHSVTPISINGQMMYMGSSVTDDPVEEVLDRYDEACKKDPGQPNLGWKEVPMESKPGGPRKEDAPDLVSKGVMRAGSGGQEGSLLCFMRGDNTKPSTEEAWTSLMQTGELGALGKARYVYAKRTANNRTLVLTAWTESKFNLNDMMPGEGVDAPGQDFPEIPRVPNSFRALSAHAEGLPYGVNVYKTTDTPQQTLAYYDKAMVSAGWRGVDPELDAKKEGYGRNYLREGVVLSLGISVQKEGNFVALGLAGVGADSNSTPTPTVSREP